MKYPRFVVGDCFGALQSRKGRNDFGSFKRYGSLGDFGLRGFRVFWGAAFPRTVRAS